MACQTAECAQVVEPANARDPGEATCADPTDMSRPPRRMRVLLMLQLIIALEARDRTHADETVRLHGEVSVAGN